MKILPAVICSLSLVMSVYAISVVSNTPDVLFSHSTNECVQVLNYTLNDSIENYTCDNLPSRYNHVWVK